MKREKFSENQKAELLKSPAISSVGVCYIVYSPAFRLHALEEYQKGKSPIQIFRDAKIDVNILGTDVAGKCLRNWRRKAECFGKDSLLENLTSKTKCLGRPRLKPLSLEEENKRLKAQNEYLKEENDFLKKLEALERGVM
jgi:transposase-like protein